MSKAIDEESTCFFYLLDITIAYINLKIIFGFYWLGRPHPNWSGTLQFSAAL